MAAVDASPRPERIDSNSESRNASSNSQLYSPSTVIESPNFHSLSNPSPNGNLNPSASVQIHTTTIPPSFTTPFVPLGVTQFGAVTNPNPSFPMSQSATLQPPGVAPPGVPGSAMSSTMSPAVRPVGMYQSVPGQPPVQLQYGQVQNGFMNAGAIPPPGVVPRYPAQFAGMIRPGFAPRPIPQILRPNMTPIRPGLNPPMMNPLLRPVMSVPLVEKPQTTVYVGKIASTVDNDFLLSLLKLCGPVKSWKRAQDPSDGKPKGFGFCEFEAAEGVLRALRLLAKMNLDGQELVLNINQATREYLEKYVERKKEREKYKETENSENNEIVPPKQILTTEESKKESEDSSTNKEEEKFGIVNDEDRKADKESIEMINSMLQERSKILPPPPHRNTEERENNYDSGERNSEDNLGKVGNEEERSRRERSRERDRKERERDVDRYERERERDRVKRERDREDRVRQTDRILKDRLKDWENREREREYQREREREKEKDRERERRREVNKQEEESEDENDSRKRRRRGGNNNNNGEERRRKRQREKEEDVTDKLKEDEEIEEASRRREIEEQERLIREQEEFLKEEREKEERLERQLSFKEGRESLDPMQLDADSDDYTTSNNNNINREITELGLDINNNNNNNGPPKILGFGLFGSGKKSSIPSVFHEEEDEEQDDKKMRPLVPIDYSTEELQAFSLADNNNNINNNTDTNGNNKNHRKEPTKKVLDAKQLIDMIPKTKEELFSSEINWTVYDKHKLQERMRPWISKKITEFLGEEEETLVDYIVTCMKDHVHAEKLLELLQAILDDEAEMFVLKMWRMLIFEIKKVETGLAKTK